MRKYISFFIHKIWGITKKNWELLLKFYIRRKKKEKKYIYVHKLIGLRGTTDP